MLLNEKQTSALNLAIEGHNLLLTGIAGTGKSRVVCDIYDHLTRRGRKVQLTCSTGIACTVYPTRYNALTLHQFTGIDDGRHEPDQIQSVIQNNAKYEHVIKSIMSVDVLILDECSMISRRTFESLSNICKMKDSSKVFGGTQIIFSRDFFQLPPVPNRRYQDDGSYCFESTLFADVFPHNINLTAVIRQNELPFIELLKEIYSGTLSECGETYLKTLSRPLPDNCDSVKLFSTNMLVDQYNRKCLLNHPGEMLQYSSIDSGNVAELHTVTAPKTLWLKVGSPVILLRNLSSKLVNGLRGRLVSASNTELSIVFPSLDITSSIKRMQFSVFDPKKNANIAAREQFPIKPAYALTIHKAQGMTLEWVEVNCRDIFKQGQLGVAMSRASSSGGLRVINFHKRCIFQPPALVTDFMSQPSSELLQDLSCCRFKRKEDLIQPELSSGDEETEVCASASQSDSDLDDDFNDVIACIDNEEQETLCFNFPENFDIKNLLTDIAFKKEVTESHRKMNSIISSLQPDNPRLVNFLKRVFLKMSTFITSSGIDIGVGNTSGIPESKLVQFLSKVHEYTTSLEYVMSCMFLCKLDMTEAFDDNYRTVCYKMTEYIRRFLIKQKADLFTQGTSHVTQRFVTDASRSRIRYVAGYCVAKLRKKYVKIQQSNTFSNSKSAQVTFINAKTSVQILNILKEEEHYLKQTTTDPESLLDTDRRQNINRGLTNLTDESFNFFLNLTDICLSQLIHKNLDKSMYNNCLANIRSEKGLYQQFSHVIVSKLQAENIQEFYYPQDHFNLSDFVETLVVTSAQICNMYDETVQKYLMVLFAQFCRDVKSFFQVQKTMAHRKQIKVSKVKSSGQSKKKSKSQDVSVPEDPQPSTSVHVVDPQPGTSNLLMSDTDDSELCKMCHIGEGNDWIQCGKCDGWFHRKCAGLSNAKKWKKFSKAGVSWICKSCL